MNARMFCVMFSRKLMAACALGVAIASTHAYGMEDKRVRVVNQTGQPIVAVFASHDYDQDIGSNLLNMRELWSGYLVRIDPDDGDPGCNYDFLVLLKNSGLLKQRVNACMSSEIVFLQ
ncbi:hypothetical protein [Caballeronia novacaledonica]|uniref:Uncharacterized protein n=1 Tax=Caballeronia novacaledonica TaxID=1544861 RepID=A0AA37IK27_9BURK|nr:hypothetical protein [Caballeronia novacaledonica]GJH30183.1 hypothetical protein CBA19CS42_36725 [Caballeronia novacaledonica]